MKLRINFKRSVTLILIAIVTVVSQPMELMALGNPFYSQNNIDFYDESAQTCIAGRVNLWGSDNRQKVYNFLIDKGLSPEQAVGVVANIYHESGYSPTRQETTEPFPEGGFGLAQWTFDRRDALEDYLARVVPDIYTQYYSNDYGGSILKEDGYVPRHRVTKELMPLEDNDALLEAELNFLYEETTTRTIRPTTTKYTSASRGENEWEALRSATSVEDATKIWLYNFEIPANISQAAITRSAEARQMLPELKNSYSLSSLSDTGSSVGRGCVDTQSGDIEALQATVKLYAWPEYHGPGFVEKKPEYKRAVDIALANGGYVGGFRYRGVDCGGFVTRVMIDSGYEPDYNSKKGATPIQKEWLDANWERLGTGDTIDVAQLRPGDVAWLPGHTFMFAGKDIEGFGQTTNGWKGVASSSLDQRAPMAGLESLTKSENIWYRKKVNVHE